jgi:hypothetical protein
MADSNLPLSTDTSVILATVPPKPGFKTSEFWLKVAAMLLTALFASGAVTNNTVLAVAGIAASMLGALGYTVARSLVKSS